MRLAGALLDAGGLEEQSSRGRGLRDERERAVLVTVISTGTTLPRWASVAALYCLQNSIC